MISAREYGVDFVAPEHWHIRWSTLHFEQLQDMIRIRMYVRIEAPTHGDRVVENEASQLHVVAPV